MKSRKIGKGRWVLGNPLDALAKLPDSCANVSIVTNIDVLNGDWASLYKEMSRITKPEGVFILAGSNKYLSPVMSKKVKSLRHMWTLFRHNTKIKIPKDTFAVFSKQKKQFPLPCLETPYGLFKCYLIQKRKDEEYRSDTLTSKDIKKDIVTFDFSNMMPLIKRILSNYTKPNDIVINPYAEDGNVALACEELGLRWLCLSDSEKTTRKAFKSVKEKIQ